MAKKAVAVDVDAILAGAVVDKKGGSSSKVPVIAVSDGVKALVTKKQEIVAKMDALQAEDDVVSADLIESVTPLYEQKVAQSDFTSSVKVPAIDGSTITVSWKSAYTKIATAQEGVIKSVVGDNYDHWFTKATEITVKDKSPEFLTQLIALVGADKFKQFFAVEQTIVPTATFTEEKYRKLTKEQRMALADTVKQYKPSIRAK